MLKVAKRWNLHILEDYGFELSDVCIGVKQSHSSITVQCYICETETSLYSVDCESRELRVYGIGVRSVDLDLLHTLSKAGIVERVEE